MPHGLDLDRAERIAIAAAEQVSTRDTSKPVEVFYEGVGGDTTAFTVRFWIPFGDREPDFLAARSDAVKRIRRAFDRVADAAAPSEPGKSETPPSAAKSAAETAADTVRDPR